VSVSAANHALSVPAELSSSASTTLRNGVNRDARTCVENGPARPVQTEQWQGAAIN
jgi:hypothetical protein